MKNFIPCAINSEAWIVLSLLLIFGDFEPRCSYNIALIKKIVDGQDEGYVKSIKSIIH